MFFVIYWRKILGGDVYEKENFNSITNYYSNSTCRSRILCIYRYDARRELIAKRLTQLGWDVYRTPATMYFWLKVPDKMTSKDFCKMVLDKTGVVFTPGIAFGSMSDDHFRFSIVQPEDRLNEAFDRMEKAGIRYS